MSITALIARKAGADFEVAQVDLDAPLADEILVRIHGVGLCHTDLAARDQHMPTELPAVLGHEGAGVVEAVGSNVTKVKIGDRVVLTFRTCGSCTMCARGEPAYCLNFGALNLAGRRTDGSCAMHHNGEPLTSNFFAQSSFAHYSLAYEQNVVKVPDDVPLHLMGPLGCGLQTGAGATMRALACREGSSIVIFGGGSVGLSAMLGALVRGCTTVIVCEPMAERRSLALELGATHAIDPREDDLAQTLREICPAGLDYAFDTTARDEVIQTALNVLATRGTLGLVGIPSALDATVTFNMLQFLGLGLTIRGIIEGDSDPDVFIPELIDLYRQGRMPIDRLMTTYRLDDINQAIKDQHDGKVVKAVLLTDAALV
ncbi:NAD(P)-dependent alcohol dehydrogenase [Sphingobium sp. SCG-1]|uniref:NAD(P)-dependent alcohol dehydrogenase n=1 Tax=Sphingobium sp. SCG-1 TaxID=2072936 RepID=UPI000CD69AA1|nr:NAD(P)-dependent alcohol dehydrogenase [Sphingobium sp. SCG-1]AUW59662.1 NAD(P)-dependent alcohol dehydrogenase [Sphingobium sp. SCG-1]